MRRVLNWVAVERITPTACASLSTSRSEALIARPSFFSPWSTASAWRNST